MKQHINTDDLNQLSEKGKERLRKWWKPELGELVAPDCILIRDWWDNKNCWSLNAISGWSKTKWVYRNKSRKNNVLPLLSIGQLLEFLDEHRKNDGININIYQMDERNGRTWDVQIHNYDAPIKKYQNKIELCDALWKAVKEVLEKEDK